MRRNFLFQWYSQASYEEEAAHLLGIPYAEVMQVALIPVAYTQGTAFRPGSRKPLETKCSISEMKTRLTSYFPACLLGVSSENHGINCETEH